MRDSLLSLCFGLALTISSVLAQVPIEATGISDTFPIKVGGQEHIDAGALKVGEWATHTREIANHCDWPVSLRVMRSSCPSIEVHFEPDTVYPDEVGIVRLRAPVIAVAGQQTHFATVEASATDDRGMTVQSKRFDLAVSYQADLALIVEPEKLWIAVVVGHEFERVVALRSNALDALNVRSFAVTADEVKISTARRFPVPAPERPGEEALVITLSGAFQKTGVKECALTFQTDDPTFASMTIPIQIAVRDFWLAVPAGFPIIIQDAANPVTQEVTLFGRDGSTCPVASVELREVDGSPAKQQGFSFSVVPGTRDQSARVRLVCDVSKIGDSEGTMQIALLDREGSLLRTLPVAWVRVQPAHP